MQVSSWRKGLGTAAALLSASVVLGAAEAAQAQVRSFVPLTQFAVDGAVAEIIAATPDGQTVVYTNAGDRQIGFLNISNPRAPQMAGTVDVSRWGEPTAVAVTPNGRYALVSVLDDESEIPDQQPGTLVFVDLATQAIAADIPLDGIGPDNLAVTPDGTKAIIAIEDEEDEDNLPGDRPGSVNFVTLNYDDPAASTVSNTPLDAEGIAGVNYDTDPQPEYVTITPDSQTVAVSLQENNAIALLDVESEDVIRIFSAGTSLHDRADTQEEDDILFTDSLEGRREPDSIAFTSKGHIITANEGDTSLDTFGDGIWSGGRGWSILDTEGNVVYDSGDSLEELAILHGQYPDGRSENRGIEVEGATVGMFGEQEIAFVASERGSFVAIYDITTPETPELLSFLPTGLAPEGLIAIPDRNLFLTANEDDGTINVFQASPKATPHYTSTEPLVKTTTVMRPFSAISGMVTRVASNFYAVPDNAVAPSRIYSLRHQGAEMIVNDTLPITKNGEPVSYDLEGIAIAPNGDLWLVSEGDTREGRERPNLLIRTNSAGVVQEEIGLPPADAAAITRFGFEGVTTGADGRTVYVAIQRAFEDESMARIAAYDVASNTWDYFFYPLDTDNVDGWVGLSEISRDIDGSFVVVERDNQGGEKGASDVRIKRVYRIDLDQAKTALKDDHTGDRKLTKTLVVDLVEDYDWLHEKVESLAVTEAGYWIASDNDGGVQNTRMLFVPVTRPVRGLF
ncbi:MAG: esterase-like activity of phytase family protein [Spirulinaceae cyanobacterium]